GLVIARLYDEPVHSRAQPRVVDPRLSVAVERDGAAVERDGARDAELRVDDPRYTIQLAAEVWMPQLGVERRPFRRAGEVLERAQVPRHLDPHVGTRSARSKQKHDYRQSDGYTTHTTPQRCCNRTGHRDYSPDA